MYGNSRVCIKSDAWSATTTWKHKSRKNTVPVLSHTTECLRSIRSSYDKINKEHSHAPNHKIRSFLLKADQDTHRLKDWWQCRSLHQQAYHYYDVMYQNSNRGHSEEKHERSKKKIKIAIPAITAYASILMRSYKHYEICSVLRERL